MEKRRMDSYFYCNCQNIFYDCQSDECQKRRRSERTALFDYFECKKIAANEGWKEEDG